MAVVHDNDPYLLHYRRQTTAEAARLNTQHDLIKHAILQGQLIHQSIPLAHIKHAVADLGCGTGIWLEDAAKLLSANSPALDGPVPWLVGFDTTIHPSQRDPSSRVQLVEHDCSTAFEDQYLGKFDLVNIRGLAYAVPKEKFSLLIQNANRLLRPGGYLQWTETEARLWKSYPENTDISVALRLVDTERMNRQLVPYLPHFMLREILSLQRPQENRPPLPSEDAMVITNFDLLPGGISRDSQNAVLNSHFSDIVLESLQLLLRALVSPKKVGSEMLEDNSCKPDAPSDENTKRAQGLIESIGRLRTSNEVLIGGLFPHLVAYKSV